ncbi:MAG TPA: branched-chain amino acid ABC transporter substrate-binding protein [Gaiellaceae bacterium]|nr:branched-chain amino acid ABC transporter substrate-binding protein [Gaiellaceae bacterium]
MRRAATLLSLALVLGLSLVAAGCGGDDDDEAGGETTTAATTEDGGGAAADCTGSIGVMAPITGDAASIGTEQLNFTKFAVSQYNEENGTSFELVEGDTQLDPAQASTVAQRFVSDDDILAVIGPAGSQEVEAVGPIFTREDMGFISGSATATALTESGDLPTFYRVVPNDAAQGPTIGEFIAGELEAESVFIIDDQTSYSTGLADSATEALEEAEVEVQRDSVNQDQSDFSALVSRAADADVVFLPWQLANKGQVFAQQLNEQGSDAVVFGSDGLFSADFTAEGSYVSSFAPDITAIDSSADLVEAYEAEYGEFTSTFGPPMYAATQAALAAISAACEEGEPTREAVAEKIGETDQQDSILGDPISFDENGDVEGARFYIFRVLGGGDYESADS